MSRFTACRGLQSTLRALAWISATAVSACADSGDAASPRLYLTGIVGSSFATLADDSASALTGSSANATLFSAGGALGLIVDRPFGDLRVEVEGRGRDTLRDDLTITGVPLAEGNGTWEAADGWSTTVNLWRDLPVTDDVGVYLGGGIGAGGYRYTTFGSYQLVGLPPDRFFGGPDSVQGFAWQAGCGVNWALSERLVLDVGYRFFALAPATTEVTLMEGHFWRGTEDVRHAFSAGELLLSLRVEEPFRFLRR